MFYVIKIVFKKRKKVYLFDCESTSEITVHSGVADSRAGFF